MEINCHGNQLGRDVFEVREGPGHGDDQKSEGRGAHRGEVRALVAGDVRECEGTIVSKKTTVSNSTVTCTKFKVITCRSFLISFYRTTFLFQIVKESFSYSTALKHVQDV